MQALEDCGFEFCTEIQALTLPVVLDGNDVAGQAQTGTGKTAAFLLATFAHLIKHPAAESRKPTQPRALILAPTRELAIQIHKDAEALGKHSGFKLGPRLTAVPATKNNAKCLRMGSMCWSALPDD